MNVPLVNLRKQYDPLKEQMFERVNRILDSMQLFLGENVQGLEKEFAQFSGAVYGVGVSDGTTALHIILRALDIGPGDEVITVSHTFIATAEAIILAGAKPVFVDIDPQTCLMDLAQVEAKITPRTRAILPVHLYGQMVDMEALRQIAQKHNLRLIEDACQAHGATFFDKPAGSLGDAAGFSFYFSKNLGAYGEGGFITTNDPEIYRKARMIRDHGSEKRYQHELIGLNGRLDEIQAAILRVKLPHLAEWNEKRREHAALYNELLKDTPVTTPVECPGNRHVYHLYVIRAPRRDELQAYLKSCGIGTGVHYPIPNHQQVSLQRLGYAPPEGLPVTENTVKQILSLPMYAELTDAEIEYVVGAIKDFYKQ
ncbi:MAG: DegT/DnrJ/EryC1/StrS family aminotransferase [Chloroflexi bacterium]|nr:MAG: DegT/DnrJ/EryC1/StrS family aminotransferase [Chloroflexota bacterium]